MRGYDADVVVVGAGVVGCAIARELARYDVRVILVEKQADVATGTTKANTAIVHAGYDADPGTWKAKLNVRGTELYPALAAELGVSFKNTGSFVVALAPEQVDHLLELKARGERNGVPGLEIISGDRLREREPAVSRDAVAALWAPTAGITSPWELAIACAENAVENGVELLLDSPVLGMQVAGGRIVTVSVPGATIRTRFVVNAAGVDADAVARMAGQDDFSLAPRKGEYYVYDRRIGDFVRTPLFPVPTAVSKGILVAPTVDGNLLAGPNSQEVEDCHDLGTTLSGLQEVLAGATRLVPTLPIRDSIATFAGLRAIARPGNDFVIGPSPAAPNLINAAGMQSPGLTAAPAVALVVLDALSDAGLDLIPKPDFNPYRARPIRFSELSREEQARLVASDPRWGQIVCRCETVTEAEIVDALHRPVPCTTVDGVKRRTRAGTGRCQGGFCGPRVVALIARELGMGMDEVTKKGGMSRVLAGRTKDPLLGQETGVGAEERAREEVMSRA
ncbi:MAG: NAD(P)/FAD-dependent oxidoreductase [Firmicutes bacterium]|nr:NAD(P)/FAD-dependent oxidoreductase [Bacillota bacterium]